MGWKEGEGESGVREKRFLSSPSPSAMNHLTVVDRAAVGAVVGHQEVVGDLVEVEVDGGLTAGPLGAADVGDAVPAARGRKEEEKGETRV